MRSAEIAHNTHTKPAKKPTSRLTIGAPYIADGAVDLTTWDARWHFHRALEEEARLNPAGRCKALLVDLLRIRESCGRATPGAAVLEKWARDYNLVFQGKASDWFVSAARMTLYLHAVKLLEHQPQVLVLLPGGVAKGHSLLKHDDLRIKLPDDLFWQPFSATRQPECGARVESRTEARDRIMALVEQELDRIEALARLAGGKPAAGGRARQIDAEAFTWAVQYQIEGRTTGAIAGTPDEPSRAVDKAVAHVLRLVQLDRRAGRGRPRK